MKVLRKFGAFLQIEGVNSVHDLHIWQLDECRAIASAHLVVTDTGVPRQMFRARIMRECLHAYGIHSATFQCEFLSQKEADEYKRQGMRPPCRASCWPDCEDIQCCSAPPEAHRIDDSSTCVVGDADADAGKHQHPTMRAFNPRDRP